MHRERKRHKAPSRTRERGRGGRSCRTRAGGRHQRTARMNQTHLSRSNAAVFAGLGVLILLVHSPNACLARSVDDYVKAFQDRRPEVRRSALQSKELASCYSHDADEESCPFQKEDAERLTGGLIELLSDPYPDIRKLAAEYLTSSTDSRVIRPLARLLKDRDDQVRAVGAGAFVHTWVHDEGIVSDLEQLLRDNNKNVRANAAMSLVLNGTRKSLDRLREAYDHETDPDVKQLFAETIKQLAKRTQK